MASPLPESQLNRRGSRSIRRSNSKLLQGNIKATLIRMLDSLNQIANTISEESVRKRQTAEFHDFMTIYESYLTSSGVNISWELIRPPAAEMLLQHRLLPKCSAEAEAQVLLNKLAVIKLNGGLGTTMGCVGPKSVIEVRHGFTFLDLVVNQIESLNIMHHSDVPIILMNSFNTHEETQKVIEQYKNAEVKILTFNQSRHPRFWKNTKSPCPTSGSDSKDYWYPPGHGDVYDALKNSGLLDQLINQGKEWIFISNIDNCGATVDLEILKQCINGDSEFYMELTDKTRSDIKGGTLIEYDGNAMLLEIAQVPPEHVDEFKSIKKFKVFNTNNLWVNLKAIRRLSEANAFKDVEVIINNKELHGKPVIQLERAAGAAIKLFNNSKGINVARSRFLPVKTCSDLFVIQSNLYEINSYGILEMNPKRPFPLPPLVNLGRHFTKVDDYLKRMSGNPDLIELDHLTVSGDVCFGRKVSLRGTVIIVAEEGSHIDIPSNAVLENKVVTGNLRIMDH